MNTNLKDSSAFFVSTARWVPDHELNSEIAYQALVTDTMLFPRTSLATNIAAALGTAAWKATSFGGQVFNVPRRSYEASTSDLLAVRHKGIFAPDKLVTYKCVWVPASTSALLPPMSRNSAYKPHHPASSRVVSVEPVPPLVRTRLTHKFRGMLEAVTPFQRDMKLHDVAALRLRHNRVA